MKAINRGNYVSGDLTPGGVRLEAGRRIKLGRGTGGVGFFYQHRFFDEDYGGAALRYEW